MMNTRKLLFAIPLLAMMALSSVGRGQSLDELLELDTPPATEPTEATEAKPEEATESGEGETSSESDVLELDPEAARRLSAEQMKDNFEQAVAFMNDAAARLSDESDAGLVTQRLQQDVIDRLQQLVDQMQQQQQQSSSSSSSSSSSGKPTGGSQNTASGNARQTQQGQGEQQGQQQQGQPQASSQSQSGDGEGMRDDSVLPGERDGALQELGREWGNLPPRLRDELNEGISEPFSPMYRRMTEDYYRRLAETQSE